MKHKKAIDGLKLFIHEFIETSNQLEEKELVEMINDLNIYTEELSDQRFEFFSHVRHELKSFLFQLERKLEYEIAKKKSLVSSGDLICYFYNKNLFYAIVADVFYIETNEAFKNKDLYLKIYEIGNNGKMKTRNTIIPYVVSKEKNEWYNLFWILKLNENEIVKNYNLLAREMNNKIDSFSSLPGIITYPF